MEDKRQRPIQVNEDPCETETFPLIIGFCDRDEKTHVLSMDTESYDYKLNGETIYRLTRKSDQWHAAEYYQGNTLFTCASKALYETIQKVITKRDDKKIRGRCKIMVVVYKWDTRLALQTMYRLGGYPGNCLKKSDETDLIIKSGCPDFDFLCFSKVPIQYTSWLSNTFRDLGIINPEDNRYFWVYNTERKDYKQRLANAQKNYRKIFKIIDQFWNPGHEEEIFPRNWKDNPLLLYGIYLRTLNIDKDEELTLQSRTQSMIQRNGAWYIWENRCRLAAEIEYLCNF